MMDIEINEQKKNPLLSRTEVRFLFDADALYIGARMHHDDSTALRALVTRRDREGSSEQLIVSLVPMPLAGPGAGLERDVARPHLGKPAHRRNPLPPPPRHLLIEWRRIAGLV